MLIGRRKTNNSLTAGQKYVLLDGHQRFKLAKKHGLKFDIREKHFKSLDDALVWVFKNQLARRNLTDEQRAVVLGKMYERQKKQGKRMDLTSGQNDQKLASEEIAIIAGVGEKTVRRAAEFARAIDCIKETAPGKLPAKSSRENLDCAA